MMRKYNLFVVQSPLQLVMAQLARDRFCAGGANDVLMVTLNGRTGRNARQMRATQDGGWRNADLVCHPKWRGLARTAARIFTTGRVVMGRGLPDRVFGGEHRNPWNRQLGALGRSLTYVDDGAASLSLVRQMRRDRVQPYPNGMPRAFSIFAKPEDPPGLCHNEFDLHHQGADQGHHHGAMIIGSKYAEMGYLSVADEVALIGQLAAGFAPETVTYVAHRDEEADKLDLLAGHGLNVVELDLPLELHLIGQSTRPAVLIGGFSTALFTCQALFAGMACHAIRLPFNIPSEARRDEIEAVYADLADAGVAVWALGDFLAAREQHPVAP